MNVIEAKRVVREWMSRSAAQPNQVGSEWPSDPATGAEAFRQLISSPFTLDRQVADEYGPGYVGFLAATRHLAMSDARLAADEDISHWRAQSASKLARITVPSAGGGPGAFLWLAVLLLALYSTYAVVVGGLLLRLLRSADHGTPTWFWALLVVASPLVATFVARRGPDRLVPLVYLVAPIALALVSIGLGS